MGEVDADVVFTVEVVAGVTPTVASGVVPARGADDAVGVVDAEVPEVAAGLPHEVVADTPQTATIATSAARARAVPTAATSRPVTNVLPPRVLAFPPRRRRYRWSGPRCTPRARSIRALPPNAPGRIDHHVVDHVVEQSTEHIAESLGGSRTRGGSAYEDRDLFTRRVRGLG
ncbi:MAG: hypothetical protein ABI746_08175, partial [Dermatophilaceae bacterium]